MAVLNEKVSFQNTEVKIPVRDGLPLIQLLPKSIFAVVAIKSINSFGEIPGIKANSLIKYSSTSTSLYL